MTHFIIGPVEGYDKVKETHKQEHPYFRTNEFGNTVKYCLDTIQCMLGGSPDNKIIHLAASGTGAMDAVVDNCMNKNDKALVVNGGSFGQRFCDILKWHSIPYDSINLKWDEIIEEKHLIPYQNKEYTALLVNINETSSGKLYDIKLLSDFCKKNNMLLIVDAISSFLADEYDMEKYGIDTTIISSHKGLCLSCGMSIISFSKRMIDKIYNNEPPKSYYFNFRDYFKNMERGQTPYTPCVSIIWELKAMLDLIYETGGKDNFIKTVKEKCNYFRRKALELGLKIPTYPKSNALTPIYFDNNSALEIVDTLKGKYNLYVNPCGGELANKLIRISHIGNTTKEDIDFLLEKMMITIKDVNKGVLL